MFGYTVFKKMWKLKKMSKNISGKYMTGHVFVRPSVVVILDSLEERLRPVSTKSESEVTAHPQPESRNSQSTLKKDKIHLHQSIWTF